MYTDARALLPDAQIVTDVCVVGSGPAGQAVALELDGLPLRVTVIETGGTEADPALDDLGVSDPVSFGGLERVEAYRRFGGNASRWCVETSRTGNGIRLAPFCAADLDGWPIGYDELARHYPRALHVFDLPGDRGFEAGPWADAEHPPLPLDPARVATRMFQFGDGATFTERHRRTLEASVNVDVLHHATALALHGDPLTGRVATVRAASAPGRELTVHATHVVLAGGGLGSTRLLLSSEADGTLRLGPGAHHLGRWFNDHLLIEGGRLTPASLDAFRLYDLRTVRGVPVMGHLELADEVLREEELLQLSAVFFPRAGRLSARQQAGFDAALGLRDALRSRTAPRAADVAAAVRGIDGIARRGTTSVLATHSHWSRGGWSELPAARRRLLCELQVDHQVEQAPHYDNRLLLGEGRDAFGQRRITVDWRWHDEDVARTMRAQELYAEELARAGVGRYALERPDGRPLVLSPTTGHFMGTTRMSHAAHDGIVDRTLRVHGVDNLLVVSGSVFPTGGFANPTLSIVALALRAADELKRAAGPLPVALRPAASAEDDDAEEEDAGAEHAARPGERGLAAAAQMLGSLAIALLVAAALAAAALVLHH